MNLRTFLLIDSLALDVAGVVLLVAGQIALGIVVLVVAALAFGGFLALGRRDPSVATRRVSLEG